MGYDIIEDRENDLSPGCGADVDNSGFVRFKPAGDRTEVKVVIEYAPPGGVVASALAKLFGEPEQNR